MFRTAFYLALFASLLSVASAQTGDMDLCGRNPNACSGLLGNDAGSSSGGIGSKKGTGGGGTNAVRPSDVIREPTAPIAPKLPNIPRRFGF
jgi:hypothetical protein